MAPENALVDRGRQALVVCIRGRCIVFSGGRRHALGTSWYTECTVIERVIRSHLVTLNRRAVELTLVYLLF